MCLSVILSRKNGVACKKQLVQLPSPTMTQGHFLQTTGVQQKCFTCTSHFLTQDAKMTCICVGKSSDLIKLLTFTALSRTPVSGTDIFLTPGTKIQKTDNEF